MAHNKKSIVGRVVVSALFAVVVAYFSVAIFGSILGHLYGQPPAEQVGRLTVRERTWCVRSLVGLRDELEGQVTLELQHPKREGDPASRWQLWRTGWEGKMANARTRCVGAGNPTLDRAFDQITQLVQGYALSVDAMIRTRSQVSPNLQDALTLLKKQR